MTETKPTQFPASEREVALLKATFKENDYLLKVLRSLFLGYKVSKADKDLVRSTFSGKTDLQTAVRKKIYPLYTDDAPLEYLPDVWTGLHTSIFGQSRDNIYQAVVSKKILLDLLTVSMKLMENPDGTTVDLSYDPEISLITDPMQTKLLGRIMFINTLQSALNMIKVIANTKDESPIVIAEKNKKDSSK